MSNEELNDYLKKNSRVTKISIKSLQKVASNSVINSYIDKFEGIRPGTNYNSKIIREYVDQVITKEVDSKIQSFIVRLRDIYFRKKEKEPLKAKKRFVVGMREIEKHMRINLPKCLFIVPNMEKVCDLNNDGDLGCGNMQFEQYGEEGKDFVDDLEPILNKLDLEVIDDDCSENENEENNNNINENHITSNINFNTNNIDKDNENEETLNNFNVKNNINKANNAKNTNIDNNPIIPNNHNLLTSSNFNTFLISNNIEESMIENNKEEKTLLTTNKQTENNLNKVFKLKSNNNLNNKSNNLDERLLLLINTCKEKKIPYFFCLNKFKLGKAVRKKNSSVSIIAIVNIEGLEHEFKRLIDECSEMRKRFYLENNKDDYMDNKFIDLNLFDKIREENENDNKNDINMENKDDNIKDNEIKRS